MKKLVILFAILLCLGSAVPLAAAEDGVISGQVVNGTPGGGSAANLELSLEAYTSSTAAPAVTPGQADGEGNFSFSGLDTGSSITYYVITSYAGVEYYSQAINFAAGETAKTAQVTVYETTEDDSAISIYLSHTIITAEKGRLNITEFFFLSNEDDFSYIGSQQVLSGIRVTALLPMPAEASDIQLGPEVGGNAIFTDSGLAYTAPLRPGYTQVTYSYNLSSTESSYTFSRQTGYEQSIYELLIQGAGSAESQQLTKEEPLELEGAIYEYFNGESIPAGQTVVIQLSGLPEDTSQQTVLWVLGTLVVLGGVFALLLRRGSGSEAPASVPESGEQQLLAEIARLDEDFENGQLDEESYRLERGQLKKRIIRMRQNSGED